MYFAVEVDVTLKEFHSLATTSRKIKKSLSRNTTYPRRMTEGLISILWWLLSSVFLLWC